MNGQRPANAQRPVVEVLLATYNGEHYLQEQIETLLQQDYEPVRILARDDGSQDATPGILQRYAEQYPNRFQLLQDGVRSGSPKGNFSRLMAASTAEYIMFSDQDDIWDQDKISSSMALMSRLAKQHGRDTPLLVYSDLTVVGPDLSVQHPSFWRQNRMDPDAVQCLPSLLCNNVVAGCTALTNRALLQLSLPVPADVFMHDWWIALLAALFGKSAYLNRSTMRYRQHAANVVGSTQQAAPLVPRWRDHTERRVLWEQAYTIANALWREHAAHMSTAQQKIVAALLTCNNSTSRVKRLTTFLRYRFLVPRFRRYIATLWYLWDKDSCKNRPAN